MVKYIIISILLLLVLPSFSYAKDDDSKLKQEYGQDLTKAPFFLRFSYGREFNKEWDQTTYKERKAYLKDYDTKVANQQAQDKADAKAEVLKERELSQEKRQEDLQERDRIREDAEEQKAEDEEDAQRQKDFNDTVKDQQRELDQLRQQAVESGK